MWPSIKNARLLIYIYKLELLIQNNRIESSHEISCVNEFTKLEVKSYVLPITEAKFFVALF